MKRYKEEWAIGDTLFEVIEVKKLVLWLCSENQQLEISKEITMETLKSTMFTNLLSLKF